MKKIRELYHFLGSVYFALILIATVTIFVISGTFIEAATQSHRYAALFTYNSPLFALLIWGFFINILFSATRRWPFKQKHIPFLTTHLGLLMLLAGVLSKHYFGVQGTMSLNEGTASHLILEPNTYTVHVEGRNGKPARHPLKKTIWGKHQPDLAKNDDFSIQLIEYYPHCQEHLTSWVHGIHAFLIGLPPMPLSEASFDKESLPLAGVANLQGSQDSPWNVYALKTSDLPKTLDQLYRQNAQIKITERATEKIINQEMLSNLAEISLTVNAQNEFIDPQIKIKYQDYPQIVVPLTAEKTLLNFHEGLQLGSLPIAVDIIQQPFLAIIKNQDHVFLFASDSYGKIWSKSYFQGIPDLLVAYDDGFAGYTTKVELPFKAYNAGRQKREEALAYQLTLQLHKALEEEAELSPPLQLFFNACKKTDQDFAKTCTSFLSRWNSTNGWLYPERLPLPENQRQIFANIDWKNAPGQAKQGCEWVVQLFNLITPDLKTHGNLLTALRDKNWPLVAALEAEITRHQESDETVPYTLLTHQLFAASELVPLNEETTEEISPEINASLFSAYLRAYGIHLASIIQVPKEDEMDHLLLSYMQLENKDLNTESIHLETPVSSLSIPAIPTKKLEENRPKIKVFFGQGEKKQSISLAYDPSGTGLKWPILHGEYLTRFQPSFKEIPYRIRLRQARQVNYANSSQPYSFESDLIITDQRNHISMEKTISMNNVHETWDGYRFYLSSITPSDETAVKHIQIVVNYDPAKYLLTYPGAIVLSCGILMLFIMRPYRRSK